MAEAFGPFQFDRHQYADALRTLSVVPDPDTDVDADVDADADDTRA
ncbi:hypothetical protein ACFVTC_20960 [Streptomyces sp. NPDC057950]